MGKQCIFEPNIEKIKEIFVEVSKKHKTKESVKDLNKKVKFGEHETITNENVIKDLLDKDNSTRNSAINKLKNLLKSFLVVKDKTLKLLNLSSDFYVKMPEKARTAIQNFELDIERDDITINSTQVMAVLGLLNDSINTESDLYKLYNISLEDQKLLANTTDIRRLYAVIGRVILLSNGRKFTVSPDLAYRSQAKLGKQMIDAMEKAGLINITENAPIVNTNLVLESGKPVEKGRGTKVSNGTVVSINEDLFNHLNEHIGEFSQLQKLIMPIQIKPPLSDKDINKELTHDKLTAFSWNNSFDSVVPKGELKKRLKSIYSNVQGRGFKIDPMIINYLKEIKQELIDKNMSFRDYFNKNFYDNPLLKALFGFDNSIINEMDLFRESLQGQELSKIAPLMDLIENIEKYDNAEIYAQLFIARNGRTHTYDSFLNYQTDKFMSRQILESTVETEYSDDVKLDSGESAKSLFIKSLAVSLEVPIDHLLGKVDKEDSPFETLFQIYNEQVTNNKGNMVSILSNIYFGIEKDPNFKTKDFWKIYRGLKAAKAIRDAGDGPIKSNYGFEQDASASGAFIKLIEAIGGKNTHENIIEALAKLDDPNSDYEDSYSFGMKKLEQILGYLESTNYPVEQRAATRVHTILKIIDPKYNGDIKTADIRTLLKYAIMTFLYGQGEANNIAQVGEEITGDVLTNGANLDTLRELVKELGENEREGINNQGKKAIEAFLKSIEGTKKFDVNIKPDKQLEIKEKFMKVLKHTIGETLVKDVLVPEYNDAFFADFDADMKELYNVYASTVYEQGLTFSDIEIDGPLNALALKNIKKGQFSKLRLSKLKETLLSVPDVGGVILKREHENEISAKVVPIHALDSAILLKTVDDILKYADYFAFEDIELDNGPMSKEKRLFLKYYKPYNKNAKFADVKNKIKEDIEKATELFNKKGITKDVAENASVMLIHDAVITELLFNELFAELYEKNTIAVIYEYDPRMATIKAIEALGKEIPKELKERVEESFNRKRAYLEEKHNAGTDNIRGINYSFRTDYNKELEKINRKYKTKEDEKSNTEEEQDSNNTDQEDFKDPETRRRNEQVEEEANKLIYLDLEAAATVFFDSETLINGTDSDIGQNPYHLSFKRGDGTVMNIFLEYEDEVLKTHRNTEKYQSQLDIDRLIQEAKKKEANGDTTVKVIKVELNKNDSKITADSRKLVQKAIKEALPQNAKLVTYNGSYFDITKVLRDAIGFDISEENHIDIMFAAGKYPEYKYKNRTAFRDLLVNKRKGFSQEALIELLNNKSPDSIKEGAAHNAEEDVAMLVQIAKIIKEDLEKLTESDEHC